MLEDHPLDIGALFLEFPNIKKGLLSIGITDENLQQRFCEARHNAIYDFVGVKEAFLNTIQSRASELGSDIAMQRFKDRLELYMTGHLCVLEIYANVENNDETPYINQNTALFAEGKSHGISREGFVTTFFKASLIGQRLLAMLTINTKNVGGVL